MPMVHRIPCMEQVLMILPYRLEIICLPTSRDTRNDPVRFSRIILSHSSSVISSDAVPDAIPKDGIWGEAGINVYNVAMSETETITTNSRVLGQILL